MPTDSPLYAPGDRVFIGGDIPALVCKVIQTPTDYLYSCSWWSGRDYHENQFYGFEVSKEEKR